MKKHVIASVKHACDAAGGQRPLAKFLGIRYCQVHQWVMGEAGPYLSGIASPLLN